MPQCGKEIGIGDHAGHFMLPPELSAGDFIQARTCRVAGVQLRRIEAESPDRWTAVVVIAARQDVIDDLKKTLRLLGGWVRGC